MKTCIRPFRKLGYSIVQQNEETLELVFLRTKARKIAIFPQVGDAVVAARIVEMYGLDPETGRLDKERTLH